MRSQIFLNLKKALSVVNGIFIFIASIMLIGLMFTTDLDLFLRYVFRSPIVGMTEITELLLLYITFLGTAWVFREDAHVVVDIVLSSLYGRSTKILKVVTNIFMILICFVFIYFGTLSTYDNFTRDVRNPTVLEMPIALATVIIPIGAFVLLLEVLVKFWEILHEEGN
jgi:TRAP-type C4-dicarboxylate transport system permease small subunit